MSNNFDILKEHTIEQEYILADSHCHLIKIIEHDKYFHETLQNYNICILDVGIDPHDWTERQLLFSHIHNIYQSIGLHPCMYNDYTTDQIMPLLETHAHHASAIGETGLDWYRMYAPPKKQLELLEMQIYVAKKYKKPIIFHARDFHTEHNSGKKHTQPSHTTVSHDNCNTSTIDSILDVLISSHHTMGGIMHCFSGTYDQAKKCMDQGLYISFSANISFPQASILHDVAKKIPNKYLLTETDAPYMLHKTVQKIKKKEKKGRYNIPLYLPYLYQTLAEIKNTTTQNIAETAYRNLLLFLS